MSPSGFLKTLPNVRLFVGWVSLRRATSSATVALISAGGRGASRYSTAATTASAGETRAPVGELELVRADPVLAVGGDDEGPDENVRPVAPVRAGVHANASAGGARDRTGELEPSEARVARAMQADRVGRAATGAEDVAVDLDRGEVALEPQHERVDAVVAREQIRAEADRKKRQALVTRESQSGDELVDVPWPRERLRRPADPDRRQARERNRALDLRHPGSPATTVRAMRHGSPTPSVTTTSPGRDQCERERRGVVERRRPATPRRWRDIVEDELSADAWKRSVAATDDVCHDRRVGEPESCAELVVELTGALVDMGLVDRDQRARLELPAPFAR